MFEKKFNELSQFETHEEIGAFLEARNIRGYREENNSCPIANFFLPEEVFVGSTAIQIDAPAADLKTVDMTPAMKDFVELFDEGYYPKLDKDQVYLHLTKGESNVL